MSRHRTICISLFLALTAAELRAADESIPDLGGRTDDGLVVRCYWTGIFDMTERFGGQGVRGVFGQALSPLNGEQKTHAAFILSQEEDASGHLRNTVRTANWSSSVRHLHYWSKDGDRPAAGAGGSGQGQIAARDLSVGANETDGKVNLAVSINTTGDACSFDVQALPLEIKGLKVRVAAQAETQKWKAGLFGISASDVPVPANGKIVIRQVWGDPGAHSDFYAKWIVTRICQAADVHLVEPQGTKTQYTFDANKPGKLEVKFKASVTPSSAGILQKMKDHVAFAMETIGSSKMEWDAANPAGKPIVEGGFLTARLNFTGLPDKNDDFGKKKVELLVDGRMKETVPVKVFFPKDAANHPGGISADPNWFYYWQEGKVCGIAATDVYDPDLKRGWGYSKPSVDSIVRLCRLAPGENSGPEVYKSGNTYGSVTVTGVGKGIKCVAETLEHERHHIFIYKSFHQAIAANAKLDVDGDEITPTSEGTLDGLKSDPKNGDTFKMGGGYSSYGDNEVRCRKVEVAVKVPYYPRKDWANPGCQSLPAPFGP